MPAEIPRPGPGRGMPREKREEARRRREERRIERQRELERTERELHSAWIDATRKRDACEGLRTERRDLEMAQLRAGIAYHEFLLRGKGLTREEHAGYEWAIAKW